MIWRLEHPIRGLAAAVALWLLASWLVGFGMGILEMLVLVVVSVGVVIVVGGAFNRRTVGQSSSSGR